MLELQVRALIEGLASKGLILEGELEIINKSIVETVSVLGHDQELVRNYLEMD